MSLQILIRESGDVTILDLLGRATIGADSDLLSSHLQRLVANGVRKLLLNLSDVTQVDSSSISAITDGMRRPVSAGCDKLPMNDALKAQRKGDRL